MKFECSRSRALFALTMLFFLSLMIGCKPDYPKCEDDENCKDGEFCVLGTCQQCRSDADCAPSQACNGGRCDPIEGYCQQANDCGEGEECRGNRCVASTVSDLPPPATDDDDLGADAGMGPCAFGPIYFAFDAHALEQSARSTLQQLAACLKEKQVSAHLTGHCDPRGTEEYNLALGEKRAQAARAYLETLGVAPAILSSSSMGEELADPDASSTWDQQRKVDISTK